jgi:integrase/recombinase XerD
VTIRKRDDHPHGARGKSRTERVVDLHEPFTLEAVSRYVMHERPLEATSPFVFLVGRGRQRCEPLSYDALVQLFSRRMSALGLRTPGDDPACPAPHACSLPVIGRVNAGASPGQASDSLAAGR